MNYYCALTVWCSFEEMQGRPDGAFTGNARQPRRPIDGFGKDDPLGTAGRGCAVFYRCGWGR
jgi:hypothetical protein